MRRPPASVVVALGLALLTLAAFWPAGRNGFVNLDDDAYVEFAPMVNHGIHPAAVIWAFTAIHTSNWHPLTTLSHMLDCELFGVKPAPMHWENVGWHVLNALLVFLVWRRYTGALWRPALIAAFFAIHPLRVESVAWISERKDLLCAFFWLLGLLAYQRWRVQPSVRRYLGVAACLVLALLAKPMAVTFPATLLLLDFWPLGRWPDVPWRRLFVEKLPLFAIVVAHSVVTFAVQHASGAADYAKRIPLDARLANAAVSYVRYLGKTLWPAPLSPLYHHPGYWPLLIWAGALLLLLGVSVVVWRQRRLHRALVFGWLWFLGTLVPVIGVVQVGAQALADRYTYLPLLGPVAAAVWIVGERVRNFPHRRTGAIALAGVALAVLAVLTQRQVTAWADSVRLYERAFSAGDDNVHLRYLYASALQSAGRPEAEVVAQYRRAVEYEPTYVNAHTQLAVLALQRQRFDEARRILEQCLTFEPENASVYTNLGAFWSLQGDYAQALPWFERALKLAPQSAGLHRELASLYANTQRPEDARRHYELAIRHDRWGVVNYTNYGVFLGQRRAYAESRRLFAQALWIEPGNEASVRNLAALDRIAPKP